MSAPSPVLNATSIFALRNKKWHYFDFKGGTFFVGKSDEDERAHSDVSGGRYS